MSSKGWISNIAGALLLSATLLGSASYASDVSTHETMGSVARGMFTTAVVDREPQDELTSLSNDHYSVSFFSELKNMAGQKVTHRWEYNGQVMAEVSFDVGGDRWRIHSSKNLQPIWLGEWTVSVLDSDMNVVSTHSLDYTVARSSQPAAMQK
jgi:hypothetical protein